MAFSSLAKGKIRPMKGHFLPVPVEDEVLYAKLLGVPTFLREFWKPRILADCQAHLEMHEEPILYPSD